MIIVVSFPVQREVTSSPNLPAVWISMHLKVLDTPL